MLKIPEKFNYATNIYLLIDWPNNLRHNLNIEHRYYFKGAGPMKKMIDIGYHAVMDKKDEIIKLVGNKPRIKDKIIWRINTTKRRKNHS